MTISLERLDATITAGETFLDHYKALRKAVERACLRTQTDPQTAAENISILRGHLFSTVDYLPAELVLTRERMRYDMTYRQNIKERERKAARAAGLPPRNRAIKTRHPRPNQPTHIPSPLDDQERIHRLTEYSDNEDADINDWLTTDPQPSPQTTEFNPYHPHKDLEDWYANQSIETRRNYDKTPDGQERLRQLRQGNSIIQTIPTKETRDD